MQDRTPELSVTLPNFRIRLVLAFLLTLIFLWLATPGFSQVPTPVAVTGHAGDASGRAVSGLGLQFQLANCGGNSPRVVGHFGILKSTVTLTPDSTGLVTGQIWPNDVIECGGTTGQTFYYLTVSLNNVPQGPAACYQIATAENPFNLDVASPCDAIPGPPGPTPPIDVTYHNLNLTGFLSGTSGLFTGQLEVGSLLLDTVPSPCPSGQFATGMSTSLTFNCSPVSFPTAPVTSVFGRGGPVTAQAGDYSCSQVTGCPTSLPVTSVFGRAGGAVAAQTGDYNCSQVTGAYCGTPAVPFAARTDVTGSRSFGLLYQNTGTVPMWVEGYGTITGGAGDSTIACDTGTTTSVSDRPFYNTATSTGAGKPVEFHCMVPPSSYYRVSVTNIISGTPGKWYETQ